MLKRNNKDVKHIYKGNSVLPEEYEEVEYLESTGTQWIDTGVVFDDDDIYDIHLKFLHTDTETYKAAKVIFGCQDNNVGIALIYRTSGTIGLFHRANTPTWTVENDNLWHDLSITIDSNIHIKYDELLGTYNKNKGAYNKKKIYLFANNFISLQHSNVRCAFFKIKDKINLIPCYRKSDNKPGMYDLVSGEFFINQGEGEFIKGPEVKKKVKYILNSNLDVIFYDLPYGYTKLEYLNFDSHQAIWTDLHITKDSIIKCNISLNDINKTQTVWCYRKIATSGLDRGASFFFLSKGSRWDVGNKSISPNISQQINTNYSIILKDGYLTINNINYGRLYNDFTGSGKGLSIGMSIEKEEFAYVDTNGLNGKIYYIRIDNNLLIPVSTSNGIKGLYNIQQGKFYEQINDIQ